MEWLKLCLTLGFNKEGLKQLSDLWDKLKDENGGLIKSK